MNKQDLKRFNNLKKALNITTIAEEVVLNHLFRRDKHREILVWDYGEIKEYSTDTCGNWVRITTRTNRHSFNFSAYAPFLEKGDEHELYQKID